MRLDHIAYRVKNRYDAANVFQKIFGYTFGAEFTIKFDDGSGAQCMALLPPEKNNKIGSVLDIPWSHATPGVGEPLVFHMAPEIFVSDGTPGSVVGDWVEARNGGGVHHMAYQVENIEEVVRDWKQDGIRFLSEEIIDCPEDDLRQIFTKPIPWIGGMIFELIERGEQGFCQNSVKALMNSTKGN